MPEKLTLLGSTFLLAIFISTDLFSAGLEYPVDIVGAPDGTIFIADRKLPGVWKVSEGKFTVYFQAEKTFRTPLNAVRCVALTADGTLIAGDSATREVYKFDDKQQPVPLTNGRIGIPSALYIDGDTIYVADLETQRIWSLPVAGGEPKEVAVIAGVRGLGRTPDGELICCTTLENPLRTISDSGEISPILNDRPFQMPHHIVVRDRHVFVADNYANTIWKVELNAEMNVSAFVKGEPMQKPVGLGSQGDDLLVADPHAKKIFRVSPSGELSEIPFAE